MRARGRSCRQCLPRNETYRRGCQGGVDDIQRGISARSFRRNSSIPRCLRRGPGAKLALVSTSSCSHARHGGTSARAGAHGIPSTREGGVCIGWGGVDCHVDWLLPHHCTLTSPRMGLLGLASFEELCSTGCRVIEDFKDEPKHYLLYLGDREGLCRRDKLEGGPHQVGVPLRHELNPSNIRARRCTLSGCHKRNEPALVQMPAQAECLETQFLRSGRGMLRLGGLRGGDGGDGGRYNPMPNGGG